MADKKPYEFTYQGRIVEIGEVQKFDSGFRKRTLVIDKAAADSNYPCPVPFTLMKDDVSKADGLRKGMEVKVNGYISGRAWTSPKDGQTKYFCDLQIFGKIEVLSQGSSDTFAEAEGESEQQPDEVAEDMPF